MAISLPTSITEANCILWISQRILCKLTPKVYHLKKQQQEEQVSALVNAKPGSTKRKILQHVKRAEHTKAMFLLLPSIKPKPSKGISLIKVPTDLLNNPKAAEEWPSVTDTSKGEHRIMDWQKLHVSQATPTPFAKEPLTSCFNWTGTSAEAKVVLDGNYLPSLTVDVQFSILLQSCLQKMPALISSILLNKMRQKY
jgi:hypothetical protein